ncbi:MAG: alpha-1,3-galactosidase B [Planctomycetia bacterium]|nr:alpha-1,3-galactosidase B [Planctomycetia bacterium]
MRYVLRFCFVLTLCIPGTTSAVAQNSPGSHGVPGLQEKLDSLKGTDGEAATIAIPMGTYHFYVDQGISQVHYISNHDQDNPKSIGIVLDGLRNVTLDGQGSKLIFHGRMIPFVLKNCENCTLKNFAIDFDRPGIAQVTIVGNTPDGITARIAPEHTFELENNQIFFTGNGWRYSPSTGIAFDGQNRQLVYRTSDLRVSLKNVRAVSGNDRTFVCPEWVDERLVPGTRVALRPWWRPAPAIFLYLDRNTTIEKVHVHYAEGMGLLAQLCDGIHLDGFHVCLRETDQIGDENSRYFTAQADATHFSGCRGLILSENGLYENMMDDAINVHGTYLNVLKYVDERTLEARYMHNQSWGFHWGDPGDDVQFVRSRTMEITGAPNVIETIEPVDQSSEDGARVFRIRFREPVPEEMADVGNTPFGIENLTWTPEVIFRKNVIRNNRARGALFSTPRRTVIEDNLFDHTSGTAILLCGDCNGWYETGACREVVIRRNRFLNSLTSLFQFTNAIISIYPEVPDLKSQKLYFHGGKPDAVLIEENEFVTFDKPIVYARSLDGLTFQRNTIRTNSDFPAFHWNQSPFFFERVVNVNIDGNDFDTPFDPDTDVRSE